MKKQTPNECHSGRPWVNELDRLFLKYRVYRDEDTKNMLSGAFSNAYTLDYVKAKRPSFSDLWCEYIYGRLVAKFLHVLSHPECVTKGLTAYMSCALYSLAADVYRHYSKEAKAEDEAAKEAQIRVSERLNAQRMKFAEIVWNTAMNKPCKHGKRDEVFRYYVLGLISRAEGEVNKEYTIEGIASKLGLTQTCVATHIRRAKMSLERELRPLGLKMGALSQQRHCR